MQRGVVPQVQNGILIEIITMASSESRGLTSHYGAGTQIMEATLFLNATTGGNHPPAIYALALEGYFWFARKY